MRPAFKSLFGIVGTALFLLLVCAPTWSVPIDDYKEPVPVSPPSMGALLLRLLISLIIVIGLAVVVIKFLQRRSFFSPTGHWIRILDQVVIGPNRALLLAEIVGKIYVIAVTDHSITKLLEIEDESQVAAILEDSIMMKIPPLGDAKWYPFWKKTFHQILSSKKENLKNFFDSRRGDQ